MNYKTVFANSWIYVSAFLEIAGMVLAIIVIPGNMTIAYMWLILARITLGVAYIILLVDIHNLKNIAKRSRKMNIVRCHLDANDRSVTYLAVVPYAGINHDRCVSIYYGSVKQ